MLAPVTSLTMAVAHPPTVLPVRRRSALSRVSTGLASWYGKVLDGHLSASGRRFAMMELTAANNTLPFGSIVRVTDLRNHKSVIVTITDRGELAPGRVIDLSYAAAEALDMLRMGVDPVHLEVIGRQSVQSVAAVTTAPLLAEVEESR